MNIQPTPIIASLSGTAQAQTHASDATHASGGGGAAARHELNKTAGLEAGAKTDDRDADGRQLFEHRRDEGRDDDSSREAHAGDPHDDNPLDSPRAAEGPGSHIDFDA